MVLSRLALVLIAALPGLPAEAAWTQWQGNARHNGVVSGTFEPASTTFAWSLATEDIQPGAVFSPDVASDGDQLFLSWRLTTGTFNSVSQINIATGEPGWEWRFTGTAVKKMSGPTYMDGKVYVHRWGNVGLNDWPRLFGIDAQTGQQIFDETYYGGSNSGSRPTLIGDHVFVSGDGPGIRLMAFDANDGHRDEDFIEPTRPNLIPAATSQAVYTSTYEDLHVINLSGSGSYNVPRNKRPTYIQSTPAVASDTEVYLPNDRQLIKVNPGTEQVEWTYTAVTGISGGNPGVAINGDVIYANLGGVIHAIDRDTGELMWNWSAEQPLISNVVMMDRYVFASTGSQTYIIDTQIQDEIWRIPAGGTLAIDARTLLITSTASVQAYSLVPEVSSLFLWLAGALVISRK